MNLATFEEIMTVYLSSLEKPSVE